MKQLHRPRGRRAFAIAGLLVVLAFGGGIALERSHEASTAAPGFGGSAVAQIAGFAAAPTASSRPSAAERRRFLTAFSEGRSMLSTLDLRHVRRFSIGGAAGFSLVAAPTKTGGVCYLDSASGGTCIARFEKGSGMTEGYRKVGGSKYNVITGLLPDGVVKITFASGAAEASTPVHDNVFQFLVTTEALRRHRLVHAHARRRIDAQRAHLALSLRRRSGRTCPARSPARPRAPEGPVRPDLAAAAVDPAHDVVDALVDADDELALPAVLEQLVVRERRRHDRPGVDHRDLDALGPRGHGERAAPRGQRGLRRAVGDRSRRRVRAERGRDDDHARARGFAQQRPELVRQRDVRVEVGLEHAPGALRRRRRGRRCRRRCRRC